MVVILKFLKDTLQSGKKIIKVLQGERYDTGNKVWDTGRLFIEVKLRFI